MPPNWALVGWVARLLVALGLPPLVVGLPRPGAPHPAALVVGLEERIRVLSAWLQHQPMQPFHVDIFLTVGLALRGTKHLAD